MILSSESFLDTFLSVRTPSPKRPFTRVLMVSPEHYRIEYSINPYMTDANGKLKTVNSRLALAQWTALKTTYEKLGYSVMVLPADPSLPDMVYAANQCIPFFHGGKEKILLSKMRAPERQPEVEHFKQFFLKAGFEVVELRAPEVCFEGNGDAIPDPSFPLFWGGVGPRTDFAAYEEMSSRFGLNIIPLNLISKNFYHLDTCFTILNESTVAIQPNAFSSDSKDKIRRRFSTVIEVDQKENIEYFCCNSHSPNGTNIITQSGSREFRTKLLDLGFHLNEVDTSEFVKGGGSVFCLKMMY